MLHILSYVSFRDLYAVAKCSRRFREIAQSACAMSTGDQYAMDEHFPKSMESTVEMLNIFIDYIRHFNDGYFLLSVIRRPQFWLRLDIQNLKSLFITEGTFKYIMNAYAEKRPPTDCFLNLSYLNIDCEPREMGYNACIYTEPKSIDFCQWMPKLHQLVLVPFLKLPSYPSTLVSITVTE